MTKTEPWDVVLTTRLQACLDARQDPLDDAELCELLAAHPEALLAFAELRQQLLHVPPAPLAAPLPAPEARRRSFWARPWSLGMLAASVAIFAAWWGWPAPPPVAGKTRGVLSATLETSPPSATAAISFAVRERWQPSSDTILEAYELRSQIR